MSLMPPPATALLFRDDALLREAEARVVAIDEAGRVMLDRTPFYAMGGGQPGDTGWLVTADGRALAVTTASYADAAKSVVAHQLAEPPAGLAAGDTVTARLDWELRYRRMRMHTALHLLSVALPYPVTGGSIGETESRLDFDIPEAGLDKEAITARLAEMVALDRPVTAEWITDAELDANPGLVKTMSVQPPRGSGRVRLVRIAGLDLQPCGGTHVASTGEVGRVVVSAIEKKGKQNRRVRVVFA